MTLNKDQRTQIDKQLQEHQHSRYEIDIRLDENFTLEKFVVYQNVLRPEKMVASYLAKYLFLNNGLYKDKTVIDIGCGSGIQGIVTGLYGAKHVILSDISKEAVENTSENVRGFNLQDKATVLKGDLFQNIKNKADIIIFNHPFFPEKPIEAIPVSRTMLDDGTLLKRFLTEAKHYLLPQGRIIMPYFHLAGEINDPIIQGPKYGYTVFSRFQLNLNGTLQKGKVSITELSIN